MCVYMHVNWRCEFKKKCRVPPFTPVVEATYTFTYLPFPLEITRSSRHLPGKRRKKIINKLEYINYRQSFLKLTTKTRLKSVSI